MTASIPWLRLPRAVQLQRCPKCKTVLIWRKGEMPNLRLVAAFKTNKSEFHAYRDNKTMKYKEKFCPNCKLVWSGIQKYEGFRK